MRIEGFGNGSDVILDKTHWFRRHGTLSKVSIISLLFPAKHCDAVSGSHSLCLMSMLSDVWKWGCRAHVLRGYERGITLLWWNSSGALMSALLWLRQARRKRRLRWWEQEDNKGSAFRSLRSSRRAVRYCDRLRPLRWRQWSRRCRSFSFYGGRPMS